MTYNEKRKHKCFSVPYADDCSGCPALYWLDDGIIHQGYTKSGRWACKIEDGLMTEEEAEEIYDSKNHTFF